MRRQLYSTNAGGYPQLFHVYFKYSAFYEPNQQFVEPHKCSVHSRSFKVRLAGFTFADISTIPFSQSSQA